MPLPEPARLGEYVRKGGELLLRGIRAAPEQRAARRLRAAAGPWQRGSPRVLMVTPRDWAEHVAYQSVLAHALEQRGAEVHFLTCGGDLEICDRANTFEAPPMPCRSCRHYVESTIDAHGFPRRSLRDYWMSADVAPWPELDGLTLAEMRDAVAEGLPLGELVDIPVKWFLCSADLASDPLGRRTTREFLRSARRIAVAVRHALDELKPDVVVVLNGLFLFEAIVAAVCERAGIDLITYERAFLKETLVFQRGLPAGYYDFTEQWERSARPLSAAEGTELDDYLASRRAGLAFDQFWRFTDSSVVAGPGRLTVLFTNLTWDTAVIGRDAAFPDIRTWLDVVIRAFIERPRHRLIVRVHPSEIHLPGKQTRDSLDAYLRDRFPALPSNITIIGASELTSSYPLMDAADLGLVYTSTTGLELALAGTPVIVAGATHYRGKGFTIDVESAPEFLARLDECLDSPEAHAPDVQLARRYAHFFFFRAPSRSPGVSEPLPGLARIDVDLHELQPGHDADFDRLCDWMLHGD